MQKMVSKQRTRTTRKRQKQAEKNNTPKVAFRDSRIVGVGIAVVLWLTTMFVLRIPGQLDTLVQPSTFLPLIGDAVFALAGLVATAFALNIVQPKLIRRNSRIALMSVISLIAAAAAVTMLSLDGISPLLSGGTIVFLLPYTLAPLLATILLGPRAGLATGIFTALLFVLYAGHGVGVLFTGVLSTALIAHMLYRVRRRTRVIKLALLAGMAQVLCVLGMTALQTTPTAPIPLLYQAGACLAGAALSAVLALLILPLFEHIFGITSDISLLEFSDLGHPLLQRMALEAPGTYHHSLVVANIAQAAAEAIGANSLEARVSAYFHDIGKLTKPDFFAENIHLQDNPHDNLSPSMSTLIITSHVKEGLSLAMLHKLPAAVKRAIREHHGSSRLQCFHHKAMTQLELEMGMQPGSTAMLKVDDNTFRYQGPRPSTRVSGIICLADCVEAASRSLEKPTPSHLENMVNELVRKRIEDGQLDDCELSLRELSKIRRAFIFTLTTMLHGRIAYPKDENKDTQQPNPAPGVPSADPPADGGALPAEPNA